ncbi:MAG: hypothetical protein ACJAWN_002209, partial [Neolewinella sp.]
MDAPALVDALLFVEAPLCFILEFKQLKIVGPPQNARQCLAFWVLSVEKLY